MGLPELLTGMGAVIVSVLPMAAGIAIGLVVGLLCARVFGEGWAIIIIAVLVVVLTAVLAWRRGTDKAAEPSRVERLVQTNGPELTRKLIAIDKPGPQVIQVAGRDVRVVPLRKRGCCLVKTEAPEVALH